MKTRSSVWSGRSLGSRLAGGFLMIGLVPSAFGHAIPGGEHAAHGLAHPLLGLDHVLAILAAGLLASQYSGSRRWAVALGFPVVMLLGALAGLGGGLFLPGPGLLIAGSAIVLGLMVALMARRTTTAAGALLAMFALVHGNAHALAMTQSAAQTIPYLTGVIAGTAGLMLFATGAGHLIRRDASVLWIRLAGSSIAVTAAFLGALAVA